MCKKTNQKLVSTHPLVGGIHDELLDRNDLNLADAYNDAVCWIAELHLELQAAKKGLSSGFVRTDTTKIIKEPKVTVMPVDNGDEWLKQLRA
jgi:hypothetical protein